MLLKESACSGASDFAWLRTSVKLTEPAPAMVWPSAPSKANGTSTPWTLCPSDRTYCTWYCVSVIAFICDGVFGDEVGPGSFSASWNDACPTSLKVVGTLSTTVCTSDCTIPPSDPGLLPG